MARHRKKKQARNTVAIVGDGKTERIYFADVRDTDRPENLHIFPDFPRKVGSYNGVLKQAVDLKQDYYRVYALIDMDKVIRDHREEAYRADKAAAEKAGVIVLENNPCFEMWLLVHFMYTGRLFNSCAQVSQLLQHRYRIPGYEKSEKFCVNAGLYRNYKTQLTEQGIPNARRLEYNRADQDPLFPRAETFRFFEWYLEESVK